MPASLQSLHQQIKHLDKLTYKYAFEKDRSEYEFSDSIAIREGCEVAVHWILLNLDPSLIAKRIADR